MSRENAVFCRGFVFTIDATLALFLMTLVLITVSFMALQAQQDPYSGVQVVRTAKDALMVMDSSGLLSSGNGTQIESTLATIVPSGIGVHLDVSTYYLDGGSFNLISITSYGQPVPNETDVWGARQDFVGIKNGHITNYSIARMSIWQT